MTIKQIKKYLGVDVTVPNRSELFIYLKNIYIRQERENGKSLNDICRHLKIKSHATILNSIKNTKIYKEDPLFDFVDQAYSNRSKRFIKLYKKGLQDRQYYYTKKDNERSYLKHKINSLGDMIQSVPKTQREELFSKPPILEVAKNLRLIKTKLNNKPYNQWTKRDLETYNELIKL